MITCWGDLAKLKGKALAKHSSNFLVNIIPFNYIKRISLDENLWFSTFYQIRSFSSKVYSSIPCLQFLLSFLFSTPFCSLLLHGHHFLSTNCDLPSIGSFLNLGMGERWTFLSPRLETKALFFKDKKLRMSNPKPLTLCLVDRI